MKVIILFHLILLFGVKCRRKAHHPSRRIIGGLYANTGEFSYQVSIRVARRHRCSGTIVGSNSIITAASCFQKKVNLWELTILAGTTDLKSGGFDFDIESIIKHPDYKKTAQSDLAIIKTKEDLMVSDKINGIMIRLDPIPPNSVVNVSGWGRTSFMSSIVTKLKFVTLRLLTYNDCSHKVDGFYNITSNNLCTIGNKTDSGDFEGTCYMDKGGPVVYDNELVGVMSSSVLCGKKPDIHMRLTPFLGWINEILYDQ